jgi:hypothetical protein
VRGHSWCWKIEAFDPEQLQVLEFHVTASDGTARVGKLTARARWARVVLGKCLPCFVDQRVLKYFRATLPMPQLVLALVV